MERRQYLWTSPCIWRSYLCSRIRNWVEIIINANESEVSSNSINTCTAITTELLTRLPACLSACLLAWFIELHEVAAELKILFSRTSRSWSVGENNIKFLPILYRKNNHYLLTYLPATGAQITGWKGGGGTLTFACYSGSDYFLEFKMLNFATGEPDKVQVRDLERVVGIFCLLCPTGVGTRGKFVLSSPGGLETQGTCAGCPEQRYATGEPGKVQGRDRVGIL